MKYILWGSKGIAGIQVKDVFTQERQTIKKEANIDLTCSNGDIICFNLHGQPKDHGADDSSKDTFKTQAYEAINSNYKGWQCCYGLLFHVEALGHDNNGWKKSFSCIKSIVDFATNKWSDTKKIFVYMGHGSIITVNNQDLFTKHDSWTYLIGCYGGRAYNWNERIKIIQNLKPKVIPTVSECGTTLKQIQAFFDDTEEKKEKPYSELYKGFCGLCRDNTVCLYDQQYTKDLGIRLDNLLLKR